MKPRTRARTPSSIASNQSSKSKPSAATAASFVVSLVMAWSPFQRANAGIIWVEHPETTPTQFQPLPRRDRRAAPNDCLRRPMLVRPIGDDFRFAGSYVAEHNRLAVEVHHHK